MSLVASLMLLIGFTAQAQDSSKPQESEPREVSGFLGDYSALQADPRNGDLLIYKKSKDTLKNYRTFIIDPVTVYLLPESQDRGIDPDDLDRLARYFTDAITDQLLASGYEVVSDPGPGVADLRIAITNVEPTGGKTNVALKAGATAVSVATVPGIGMLVPRLSIGKVGIEGEIIDSVSGERLVAFVTGKAGRRWLSGLRGYKKWGDIEAAFRSWAKVFRKRLDELHES